MIYQKIQNHSKEITEQVAHFEINDDLAVNNTLNPLCNEPQKNFSKVEADPYKWSIDISSLQKYQYGKYFIFVAISRIGGKEKIENTTKIDYKKKNVEKGEFILYLIRKITPLSKCLKLQIKEQLYTALK
jgi:hypothetical protein